MNKLQNSSKEIVGRLLYLARQNGGVYLEQAAYDLDTTPMYLLGYARMASTVSENDKGGRLICTYLKDPHDGHRRYCLLTEAKYNEWYEQGYDLGPKS